MDDVRRRVDSAKELIVYKKAFALAMRLFELTKRFPAEERFALVSQVRRASRSVCLNLREAWAKRRYASHFVSKLTDCDGENAELDSAVDFSIACGYMTEEEGLACKNDIAEVGKMLGSMIQNPRKFLPKDRSPPL